MAETVTIVLPVNTTAIVDTPITSLPVATKKMLIQTSTGTYKTYLPFAPKEISYTNWGINWAQVPRDGRLPYLVMESRTLPVLSFNATLANSRDLNASMQNTLWNLKVLSETTLPIKITYGGYFESNYTWRITKFEFSSVERNPVTSAITKAEIDLEFTVIQDVVLSTGPVSGGVKPPATPAKKPTAPTKKAPKKKYKTYTVKKGDTLISIAIKLFKNASKWRYLADTNKIKNHIIKPGQKLKY